MEFAILPSVERCGPVWQVVQIAASRAGSEVPVRLSSFGERAHAEAFLHDLLDTLGVSAGRLAYEAA
jgi:hypothetical protein